jgi:DNA-binding NarL/FixJ family response regulator
MPVGKTIRVLVIDDSEAMRFGLYQVLSAFADFEWVGESSDGQEIMDLCRQLVPDVVLLDAGLPHIDVAAVTRQLRAQFPAIQVVGITGFEVPIFRERMLEAGAVAIIPKNATIGELIAAILRVSSLATRTGSAPTR